MNFFSRSLVYLSVHPGVLQAPRERSRARDLLQTSPRGRSFSPRGLLQAGSFWLSANPVNQWPDRPRQKSSPFCVWVFTLNLLFIVLHYSSCFAMYCLTYLCFVPFLFKGFFPLVDRARNFCNIHLFFQPDRMLSMQSNK